MSDRVLGPREVDLPHEKLAWILTLIAAAVVAFGLGVRRAGDPSDVAALIVGVLILACLLLAGVETFRAARKLKASIEQLNAGLLVRSAEDARSENFDPTWVDHVVSSTLKLAHGAPRDAGRAIDLDELPTAQQMVSPWRTEAERASTWLRWFSTAAVLVGLVGTLIGLGSAIEGAVTALQDSGTRALQGALSPLKVSPCVRVDVTSSVLGSTGREAVTTGAS